MRSIDVAGTGGALGLAAAASLTLLAAALPPPVAAHDEHPPGRTISVTGRAEMEGAPDLVRVSLAVESTAKTAVAAVGENASRAKAVIEALKAFTRDAGQITTTGYRLTPLYEHPDERTRLQAEKPKLVGYRAYNELIAELRDPSRAGALIDAATAAGADRVAQMHFDLADRTEALRKAVAAAGRDARAQAAAIAAALEVRLGPIRSVSTTPEAIHFSQESFASARMAAVQTPVEPGQVTVSASVQVVYDIGE